jgi:hypothetical protein
MKKIAIVHDYLKEYGGAERVVEELIKLFPQADLYTTIYMPEYLGPHAKRFENYEIRTTWLQKLPIKGKIISYVRLIAPFVFKKLDLSSYDVVITSAPVPITRTPEKETCNSAAKRILNEFNRAGLDPMSTL